MVFPDIYVKLIKRNILSSEGIIISALLDIFSFI